MPSLPFKNDEFRDVNFFWLKNEGVYEANIISGKKPITSSSIICPEAWAGILGRVMGGKLDYWTGIE